MGGVQNDLSSSAEEKPLHASPGPQTGGAYFQMHIFQRPMVVVKIRSKGPKFLQWFHLEGVYMDKI